MAADVALQTNTFVQQSDLAPEEEQIQKGQPIDCAMKDHIITNEEGNQLRGHASAQCSEGWLAGARRGFCYPTPRVGCICEGGVHQTEQGHS